MTLTEFEKLNEESYKKRLNKTVYYDKFLKRYKKQMKSDPQLEWQGKGKNYVLLEFLMFHEHKHVLPGLPCKQHIRACLYDGKGEWRGLLIDVETDTWIRIQNYDENIALNESYKKHVAEVA